MSEDTGEELSLRPCKKHDTIKERGGLDKSNELFDNQGRM